MYLRVLKPAHRITAVIQVWDHNVLVAEVFARENGVRHFHLSDEAAEWGPHWPKLSKLAAGIFSLLDVADEEMRQARAA